MKNYYKRDTKGISRYYQSSENDTLNKNLLPKDLCDKERPAHEGQYIEEDDATEKESMRKVEAVNKDNKEDLVKIGMTPP